ncbi:MAG TPA: GNAT family N-acetyltransferase, partial [Candidatus Baltobacteraceae bacterium]|nr:GNAT family N-acetyltransferase [Candidatus Baltobacteraceae bacterium]
LAGCVALLRALHLSDSYPGTWPDDAAGWITPHGFLLAWIALSEGSIVGHLALASVDEAVDPEFVRASGVPAAQLVEVRRLFVDPSQRRAGIAGRLLEVAAQYASARALHPVLETTADNSVAMRCYERNGWRRIGSKAATWRRASGEQPLLHQYELILPPR